MAVIAMALATDLVAGIPVAGIPVTVYPRREPWTPAETIARLEPGQRIALAAGARLGEVTLAEDWRDFRGRPIAAGRYGLRYALQPRLKDHVGADQIRDFALLVPRDLPASSDWIAASRRVSGTTHPAVMALVPGPADGGPTGDVQVDGDRVVVFRNVGGLVLGFVVQGRAPEREP